MSKSSTKTSTRIAIGIIAGLMLFSTVGLYAMIVMGGQDQRREIQRQEELDAELQALLRERQEKVDEQTRELSDEWFEVLNPFRDRVRSFNANVRELATEDLVVGDGDKIAEDTEYSAFYIGWLPNGEVFDSSFDNGSLGAPIPSGNLITGWTEGVVGMRFGGIRMITMPSDMAYGEMGAGTEGEPGHIAPNTPLRFIVLIIPRVEEIPFSDRILELFEELHGDMGW